MLRRFNEHFAEWVSLACQEWGFPEPANSFYERVYARLPEGVRYLLGQGLQEGTIIPQGHRFSLKGLAANSGPFSWFSRYSAAREPSPNWEYYPHVALYTQLYTPLTSRGLTLVFGDEYMDLAIYAGDRLLVYIEVKETAKKLHALMAGIKRYQTAIDLSAPDRGNDPLRKAKCIINARPDYFCGYAIGARFDYKVRYFSNNSFCLEADIIPWM